MRIDARVLLSAVQPALPFILGLAAGIGKAPTSGTAMWACAGRRRTWTDW